MEMENSSKLYVLYLLSAFADFDEAHSMPGLYMTGNSEVMELWGKHSGEGMTKMATEELLRVACEQI